MSDRPGEASGARGPCLRCTVSALVALALGGWLIAVLLRTARSVVRRAG